MHFPQVAFVFELLPLGVDKYWGFGIEWDFKSTPPCAHVQH